MFQGYRHSLFLFHVYALMRPVWAYTVTSRQHPAIFFNPVKTMVLAKIPVPLRSVMPVTVHRVWMEHSVNWTIDRVNPTPAGTMVSVNVHLNLSLSSTLGTCNDTGNQTFHCQCPKHWEGEHCERLVDYCQNVTCENNGVCRSLLGDYLCECLGDSFSGRNCETTSSHTAVYQAVSKSLGYIAILSLSIVAVFIVSLDVLKYGFGIDPVDAERKRLRRRKKPPARRRQPLVIQRFVYVDRPPTTILETSVWNKDNWNKLHRYRLFVVVRSYACFLILYEILFNVVCSCLQ